MEDGLNDSYKSGSHLGFELIKKLAHCALARSAVRLELETLNIPVFILIPLNTLS